MFKFVCVVDVSAELEDEGSLAMPAGVVMWMRPISMFNATVDNVCTDEVVVDDVIGTEGVARVVEPAIVAKDTAVEGDVGIALGEAISSSTTADKTVDVEDNVDTALEKGLSALIMSAAYRQY